MNPRAEVMLELRALAEIEARYDTEGRTVAEWFEILRDDLARVGDVEDEVERRIACANR
jgi:hypothetical protein